MTTIEALLALPLTQALGGLLILVLVAWFAFELTRRFVLGALKRLVLRTTWTWDDVFLRHRALHPLAWIAPTLVVQFGIRFVPHLPDELDMLIRNVALAGTIFFLVLMIGSTLNALEDIYSQASRGTRSIKSYMQFLKIVIYIIATVIVVAILIDRSPLILLSGLGALSAIMLLVFKDTILGLVAGVQITSNDMLRVGDWIEMPSSGADGDVIDIALHTVKVQNWDKTITTIPSWKLITESFKNWRGMSESGGRRIKRSLWIDADSVHFLDDEEIHRLSQIRLLRDYLEHKSGEVSRWNEELSEADRIAPNERRLTNLGTFRAYALAFLRAHPGINSDMTMIVRQLETGSQGIPLQLYCFTRTVAWREYEGIQSDIFDHLIAILPEFGLRLYQAPAGGDLRSAARAMASRDQNAHDAATP